jgi:hypothetical protein
MIPRGLGTDKDVHIDLHARITVDTPQSYSVYCPLMNTTESSSASAAEAEAPSRGGVIVREISAPLIHENEPGITSA